MTTINTLELQCAYSGLALTIPYVPTSLGGIAAKLQTSYITHPIFTLTLADLKQDLKAFRQGHDSFNTRNLTGADFRSSEAAVNQYLYMLAWALHMGVEIRAAANPWTTYKALYRCFDRIVHARWLMDNNPRCNFPQFIADYDEAIADNLSGWLDSVHDAVESYRLSLVETGRQRELRTLELELSEVQGFDKEWTAKKHASTLASWATLAADFPSSVAKYWHDIIIKLLSNDHIAILKMKVTRADLLELDEHCTDKLPHGSLYARAILQAVRKAAGNPSSRGQEVGIDTVDCAASEPKRSQYKTNLEFIKARMAWRSQQQAVQQQVAPQAASNDLPYIDI